MGYSAAIAAIVAASSAYSANRQHEAQNTAERQAATQERLARETTANRQHSVSSIDALYGIGNTPDAQQHAQSLASSLQDYYNAQLNSGLKGTEDQFSNASRVGRQNLARAGQLGSSLDASTKQSNLADFIRSRQQAVSQAAASRDSLQSQLTNQRLGLEGQVNSGAMTSPDLASLAQQQQSLIGQAQGQIPANAAANLFNVAGNTYFQGAQQSALGNQGLGAFWGGGSGGAGKNTAR